MVDLLEHLKKKQHIADHKHILLTEDFGAVAEDLFKD